MEEHENDERAVQARAAHRQLARIHQRATEASGCEPEHPVGAIDPEYERAGKGRGEVREESAHTRGDVEDAMRRLIRQLLHQRQRGPEEHRRPQLTIRLRALVVPLDQAHRERIPNRVVLPFDGRGRGRDAAFTTTPRSRRARS